MNNAAALTATQPNLILSATISAPVVRPAIGTAGLGWYAGHVVKQKMPKIFQAAAILTRVGSLKDGGLSLGFATQEMSNADKVTAFEFIHQFGWLLFKENEFTIEDIPKEDTDVFGESPSRRLRNVFFVWWKQLPEPKADFETFYKHQMEKLIEHFKEKLD